MLKIITWNVNGLRSCMEKGFMHFFKSIDADIFCIQETKMQEGQAGVFTEGYAQYWHSALKKGYSGTAVFTKKEPLSVSKGKGDDDLEGRILTLEYPDFYLVDVYSPNSQNELKRLSYRMEWEDEFRQYLLKLDAQKPVIVCGDFNVAHQEIDIKNAASNRRSAGFTDEEREKFTQLLDSGFTDAFRYLYPDARDKYTYWSYMFNARSKNVGWRIDYFCVSERLKKAVSDCILHNGIFGSDHCPVELQIF
jgi:exodeoxyribonuclease-3